VSRPPVTPALSETLLVLATVLLRLRKGAASWSLVRGKSPRGPEEGAEVGSKVEVLILEARERCGFFFWACRVVSVCLAKAC
jgi:hypothetical protein